ncbi:hypothetical protein FB45DRAFT_1140442 [Roridomyces roridus]|uniref:F-box domain-containing protein n=1 Tax=Roridomyces roridus TaxID=1738132 RepID=A0AAD7B031_9AGAR|nr:hypothetical protein FB45DRAFT_1140442 [Roridomyces roridus]
MDTDSLLATLLVGRTATNSFEHQVRGFIKSAEVNLTRAETQIQDLTRLCDKKRELITALKSLVAPIRHVPAELLLEIFRVAAASAEPDQWLKQVVAIRAFAAIGGGWLVFLKHSASLPIPILLKNELSQASCLVKHIYRVAPRWRSLVFHRSKRHRLRKFHALRSLETLDLTITKDLLDDTPIEAFLHAPLLRTIALNVRQTKGFDMPWSQLTHLSIRTLHESAQHFLDILVQCTKVVSVKFYDMAPWYESPSASIPAPVVQQLAQLETLTLVFEEYDFYGDIMPFFARLALPALKALRIRAYLHNSTWSYAVFGRFQHCVPRLEKLHIHGSILDPDPILSVLKESPLLVDLRLVSCFTDACWVYSSGTIVSTLVLRREHPDWNGCTSSTMQGSWTRECWKRLVALVVG